jgi:hypothetical protein
MYGEQVSRKNIPEETIKMLQMKKCRMNLDKDHNKF